MLNRFDLQENFMFQTYFNVCLALLGCTSPGQEPQRKVTFGKFISHMHPSSDEIVRQSFLLQGLPTSVINLSFGYDSSIQQDFEDFLLTNFSSPPNKSFMPIKDTLWCLASGLYREQNHVMLVLTNEQRKRFIPLLGKELVRKDLRPRDELVLRAELFYLSFKPNSRKNMVLIEDVLNVKSTAAKVVAKNLREVSRSLIVVNKPQSNWEKVGIYR